MKTKKLLKKLPKSGEFVKWCSNNLQSFHHQKVDSIKELGDFSTIEDSYNRIGYGRYFNKIQIKNKYVLKKSIDKNYNHLIKKELNWYDQVSKIGYKDIPKIYSKKPFRMEKINGKHLFQFKFLNFYVFNKFIDHILFCLLGLRTFHPIFVQLKRQHLHRP